MSGQNHLNYRITPDKWRHMLSQSHKNHIHCNNVNNNDNTNSYFVHSWMNRCTEKLAQIQPLLELHPPPLPPTAPAPRSPLPPSLRSRFPARASQHEYVTGRDSGAWAESKTTRRHRQWLILSSAPRMQKSPRWLSMHCSTGAPSTTFYHSHRGKQPLKNRTESLRGVGQYYPSLGDHL